MVKYAVIKSLASLQAQQRVWLQQSPKPSAQESTPSVVDSVQIEPARKHRSPKAALSFMEDFDEQLGISKAMQKEKRELMAESSHKFFRATPALFFHDLKTTYQKASHLLPNPAPTVSILGDAHALNAGTFRGPDGRAVWGLNDFDQADFGSPEWDLERLGVSLYVAARSDGQSAEESMKLVEKMGRSYLGGLEETGPSYLTEAETDGQISELIKRSESKSQSKFLDKWTSDGGHKLKRDDSLEDPDTKRGQQIEKKLEETFPDYKLLDLAAKPHSGGSTRGLERYYGLVTSPDRAEPWILEVKTVLPSPVQIPDGDLSRGDGAKVIESWQKMGGHVDGRHRSFKIGTTAFFTREREPEKGSLSDKSKDLDASAVNIGRVLARAHSKSGADIKGWVGSQEDTFLKKLVQFSRTYSRQVESDFREWEKQYG